MVGFLHCRAGSKADKVPGTSMWKPRCRSSRTVSCCGMLPAGDGKGQTNSPGIGRYKHFGLEQLRAEDTLRDLNADAVRASGTAVPHCPKASMRIEPGRWSTPCDED